MQRELLVQCPEMAVLQTECNQYAQLGCIVGDGAYSRSHYKDDLSESRKKSPEKFG